MGFLASLVKEGDKIGIARGIFVALNETPRIKTGASERNPRTVRKKKSDTRSHARALLTIGAAPSHWQLPVGTCAVAFRRRRESDETLSRRCDPTRRAGAR
ncbi:unnamed protein product [Lampetra fluviatilis]